MIALELSVPFACWRRGHARSFFETEFVPPPSTCYGALLSFVGEHERGRHRGARVTGGIVGMPQVSTVLRKMWRIKSAKEPQGRGQNATPDFQQLVVQSRVIIVLDVGEEVPGQCLEARVREALQTPDAVVREGGWCLGESTHLIDEVAEVSVLPQGTRLFLAREDGGVSLPVWVDHVGSKGTVYSVGELASVQGALPGATDVPLIREE